MTSLILAACSLCCGALFSLQTIPVEQPDAQCFFAETDGRGCGDLVVIDGLRLAVHPGAETAESFSILLDPETSAVDVADIDGDGQPDLVAVAGDRVLKYSMEPAGPREAQLLFSSHSQLSAATPRPFPHVLVLARGGRSLIALPTADRLELRAPSGELVESHAIGLDAAHRVSFGQPFSALPVQPPRLGTPGALQMRIIQTAAFVPALPEGLVPLDPAGAPQCGGSVAQAAVAARGDPPESWPWFRLHPSGPQDDERVFFAYDPNGARETLVRVRRALPPVSGRGRELKLSGAQRYPGMAIPSSTKVPDFNGDGYADLLLWNAAAPAPTVGAVTRALTQGYWSVRLTVHLFDPASGHYAPVPFVVIPLQVPVAWFLADPGSPPVRHLVLDEFNGNDRTDLVFATAPDKLAVWVAVPSGIRPDPHQEIQLPGPIQRVELRGDLDGDGRTSLVLSGPGAFYVLRARKGG
jgi:hypothetical protein